MCEMTLQHLEQGFGLNALARIRLGLTLVEEQSALAKLKQPARVREVKV
jgi:hypothetical protein